MGLPLTAGRRRWGAHFTRGTRLFIDNASPLPRLLPANVIVYFLPAPGQVQGRVATIASAGSTSARARPCG